MASLTLTPIPRDGGNQAGDLYRYLGPLFDSWLGVSGKGVALIQTQVNDPNRYAGDFENLDTTGSPTRKSFRAVAGSHSLLVNGSGITLSSATISGGTTIGGNLGVTGTLNVTGGTVLSTLTATGAASFQSTLGVTGTSTLGVVNAGATSVSTLSASSNVGVTGTLNVGGGTVLSTLTATGAVSFQSTLGVTGTSTLGTVNAGAISGTTGTFSSAVSGTTITGSSTIQGTQLISTVGTGTAPFSISSTTKVAFLNADQLDGIDSTQFARVDAASNFTTAPTINSAAIAKTFSSTYTGNGSGTQTISGLPFTPTMVLVQMLNSSTDAASATITTAGTMTLQRSGGTTTAIPDLTVGISGTSFVAGAAAGTNDNTKTYRYTLIG